MNSPIKYYGGKHYMTDIILKNFPIKYASYVEGFGGSASVLLSKPFGGIEIYNDLGKNVYSLFKVLQNNEMFNTLKQRMDLTYYSEQLREDFKDKLTLELSVEDRAYYFLCTNRMSYNGVGGFSTTNIVRRGMSKSTSDFLSMIDCLPSIHNRLSSVIIENKDIFTLMDKYNYKDVFMYLDPPYVHSTRLSSTKYEVEMSDDEHIEFIKYLNSAKFKWLVSGYDNDIYSVLNSKEKISFDSKNSCSNAVEVLWKNY